ncbi:MAG: hypothetical protein J0M33_14530 [Anaerolineae bacterium]|nr:hypothetical protein [Anaerolineae bacterium]
MSQEEEHAYSIDLRAGDTIQATAEAIGSVFQPFIILADPAGNILDQEAYSLRTSVSKELSSSGTYTVRIRRSRSESGAYSVSFGCTLRNGTVINPGDVPPAANATGGQGASPAPAPATSTFSGNGFPGLAPVDFSNAFVFPLALGQANPGQIPAGADAVISYTLDAQAGHPLDLTFSRTSGNLNLGLVVLNAENQVVFQASLVSANRINAQLTLPSSGTYTIGVFRIDLLPPAAPEATGFQIEAVLG